jgi:IS30 family transposase
MSRKNSIKQRQSKLKEAFLDQLKRTPTIETACQKVVVSRATIYRWIRSNKTFEKKVDEALNEGRNFMSDIAENQLFSLNQTQHS